MHTWFCFVYAHVKERVGKKRRRKGREGRGTGREGKGVDGEVRYLLLFSILLFETHRVSLIG